MLGPIQRAFRTTQERVPHSSRMLVSQADHSSSLHAVG